MISRSLLDSPYPSTGSTATFSSCDLHDHLDPREPHVSVDISFSVDLVRKYISLNEFFCAFNTTLQILFFFFFYKNAFCWFFCEWYTPVCFNCHISISYHREIAVIRLQFNFLNCCYEKMDLLFRLIRVVANKIKAISRIAFFINFLSMQTYGR